MKNNKFTIGQKINWFKTPATILNMNYDEFGGWRYDLINLKGVKCHSIDEQYLSIR